jgi:hypothetical protein
MMFSELAAEPCGDVNLLANLSPDEDEWWLEDIAPFNGRQ